MKEHQSAKCAGTDAIKTVSSTLYIYIHALVLGSSFPTPHSSELFTNCLCCAKTCVCQQSKIGLAFVLIIANHPESLQSMYFISFGCCVQLNCQLRGFSFGLLVGFFFSFDFLIYLEM